MIKSVEKFRIEQKNKKERDRTATLVVFLLLNEEKILFSKYDNVGPFQRELQSLFGATMLQSFALPLNGSGNAFERAGKIADYLFIRQEKKSIKSNYLEEVIKILKEIQKENRNLIIATDSDLNKRISSQVKEIRQIKEIKELKTLI